MVDIFKIVENLKHRPETYKTLLGINFTNTEKRILTRKLKYYIYNGFVSFLFFQNNKVFYHIDKRYYIIKAEYNRGIAIIFFSNYIKNKNTITLKNCYILNNFLGKWNLKKELTLFNFEVIKWL